MLRKKKTKFWRLFSCNLYPGCQKTAVFSVAQEGNMPPYSANRQQDMERCAARRMAILNDEPVGAGLGTAVISAR